MSTLPIRRRCEVIVTRGAEVLVAAWITDKKTQYVFPGGGIEQDESLWESSVKECLEEVGVRIEDIVLLFIDSPQVYTDPHKQLLYSGSQTYYVTAKFKSYDGSLHNREGDAMPFSWYDIVTASGLVRDGSRDGDERARALRILINKGQAMTKNTVVTEWAKS